MTRVYKFRAERGSDGGHPFASISPLFAPEDFTMENTEKLTAKSAKNAKISKVFLSDLRVLRGSKIFVISVVRST
jgi:hypothetical protein